MRFRYPAPQQLGVPRDASSASHALNAIGSCPNCRLGSIWVKATIVSDGNILMVHPSSRTRCFKWNGKHFRFAACVPGIGMLSVSTNWQRLLSTSFIPLRVVGTPPWVAAKRVGIRTTRVFLSKLTSAHSLQRSSQIRMHCGEPSWHLPKTPLARLTPLQLRSS